MAVSKLKYDAAVAAVKNKLAPDDVLDGLMDIIDEYEKGGHRDAKPDNFGEGPLLDLGGVHKTSGGGEEAALAGMPLSPKEENVTPASSPELRRARRYKAPPIDTRSIASEEEQKADRERFPHLVHAPPGMNPEMKSASQREDLFAPPEFFPEDPAAQAAQSAHISLMHPLDAASAIAGKVAAAKRQLPQALGGNVEHYYEPGLDVFRKIMGPALGPEVNKLGEDSREYREFSDLLWKQIYESASAAGKPVVRHKFHETHGPGEAIGHALTTGMGAVSAFSGGADEGLTGGVGQAVLSGKTATVPGEESVGSVVSNQEAIGSAFPISRDLGMIRGYLDPRSLGARVGAGAIGLAGKGLARLAGKDAVEGAGKSLVGKLAVGGAKGAIAAGAGSAATDVVKDATGQEDLSARDIGDRAKIAALLGLPLGAAGAGLGAASARLRKTIPSLGKMEETDMGTTSTFRGVKPSDEAETIRGRAGARDVAPRELLADEMEQPITDFARSERERLVNAAGAANRAGYARMAGQERSYAPLLDVVTNEHSDLMSNAGGKLPFSQDHSLLREQIGRMADVELVPRTPATALTTRTGQRGVARTYTPDEATRLGYDVSLAAEQAGVPESAIDQFAVRAVPRSVDPKGLDAVVSSIDTMHQRSPLPRYGEFQEAARRIRDEFPPEWGQLKSAEGQLFHEQEREFQLAGIGDVPGERGMSANQYKQLMGSLRNAGKPRSVGEDEASRSVARRAGVGRKYEQIRGLQGLEDTEKMAKFRLPGVRLFGGGLSAIDTIPGAALRLRADPLMRFLAPNFGGAGAAAPQMASQATIDQISRMLSGEQENP
jgi:hypothetical protein